jgi:4-amino-4-deoxy-L-arabinose transferase-like glycosyltransferase
MPTNASAQLGAPNRVARGARPPLAWMTWRCTVLLTLAVLAVRVAYLVFLCGYELFGDEALYWDSSRHLDLCYYEKGPVTPYLIAASTAVFGTSEWAIRLPMAVVAALATLALARLATAVSDGDQRVGFLAAVAFTLMPAYQGCAQICTPDGPLIAAWILASWTAWRVFDQLERGRSASGGAWLALGAALGVGLLCKQSFLLLVPGLLVYFWYRRAYIRRSLRLARGAALAIIAFLMVSSPMLIWNAKHGWPTFAHALGHLGAPGGDAAPAAGPYDPLWTLNLIVAQVGAFGPPAILLICLTVVWSIRARKADPQRWPARLFLICCAAPSVFLYLAVTLRKEAEGNWPFPAFSTLLVLVAQFAVIEIPRHRRLLVEWLADPRRPRPHRGFIRRRPETVFQVAWDWVGIYGVGGWLALSFLPNLLAAAPSPLSDQGSVLTRRFSGHRSRAARVAALASDVRNRTGADPILLASGYMDAALTAFYTPGRPTVYNAAHRLGSRKSSYDFWPETDLDDPNLHGRPAILLRSTPQRWKRAFRFDDMEELDESFPAYLGHHYCGASGP